jgi:hypothetical protein
MLPAALQREWLWAGLQAVIGKRGEETFLRAPLVLPNDEWFPDRWSPDERGVTALAERLLDYAGLGHLNVSVEMFTGETEVSKVGLDGKPSSWSHAGAAAWFTGISTGTCRFGAEQSKLDDPLGLVAAMAHETAHAFRHSHRLVHRDHDLEEKLTDITTIYLGFGVLTTTAAARFITRSHDNLGNSWSHSRQGYLPPEDMAFLLGSQLAMRGYDKATLRWVAKQLPANQAAVFRATLAEADRNVMADALGFDAIPEPAPTPNRPHVSWWRRVIG